MNKDTFESQLDDFVARAFWPSKAFASVLTKAGEDTESLAPVDDIATVCAALTMHAQNSIEKALALLQEHYGYFSVYEERVSEKVVAVKRIDEK